MADVEREVKQMGYGLRLLEPQDAPQAAQIEKEAFPTQWPPTPFRREVHNRLARHLVACETPDPQAKSAPLPERPTNAPEHQASLLGRLAKNARRLWFPSATAVETPTHYLVGFVGVWFMTDEAHITAVAVRSSHRGYGIGELLLIGSLELAYQRVSRVTTLEVRVSNEVAQSLYRKYWFQEAGLRKGYYVDNNEDALIMTTPEIHTPEYRDHFQYLVQAHEEHRGRSVRLIGS